MFLKTLYKNDLLFLNTVSIHSRAKVEPCVVTYLDHEETEGKKTCVLLNTHDIINYRTFINSASIDTELMNVR